MKKIKQLKQTFLACSFVMALAANISLVAHENEMLLPQEEMLGSGIPCLEDNSTIAIIVTPFGVKATQDSITLKKGEVLTIKGTIIPDFNYTFTSITAVFNEWHFISVLTSDTSMKQTKNSFSYHFKASEYGHEKITFNIAWTNGSSHKEESKICPIDVTVTK